MTTAEKKSDKPAQQPASEPSTALAIVQKVNNELEEARKRGCHVLSVYTIQEPPALHTLVVRTVKINPVATAGDVYPQQGGLAFHRTAYDRLMQAAGIQVMHRDSGRVDDGSNPRLVRYKAVGRMKLMDGTWQVRDAEKEINLDVCEKELRASFRKKHVGKADMLRRETDEVYADLLQIQKHMLARAKTGAENALVCKFLAMKKSYSADELKNEFVFPALVFRPDPNHPMDRQYLLDQGSGAMTALYGRGEHDQSPPPSHSPDEDKPFTPTTLEAEYTHVEDPAGTDKTPTPSENQRADFQVCDVETQVRILDGLIQRKAFKRETTDPLKDWPAERRLSFFDHLQTLADVNPPNLPKF